MLLFRSEEHIDRWSTKRGIPRGAAFTTEQMWQVAKAWHGQRLSPDWRRFTPDEAQSIFDQAGLTGPFWQFPKPVGLRGS